MTDSTSLADRLREHLEAIRHNAQRRAIDADEERDERLYRLAADAEDTAGALLAVIDVHVGPEDNGGAHECPGRDPAYGAVTDYRRDCLTLRGIGAALKIGGGGNDA